MTSRPTTITANLAYDASNNPFVRVQWPLDLSVFTTQHYNVYRNGTLLAADVHADQPSQIQILLTGVGYSDTTVVGGQAYAYYVTPLGQDSGGNWTVEGPPSNIVALDIPYSANNNTLIPPQQVPPTQAPDGAVVKWTFTDVFQKGVPPYTYVFDINPNDGGSPTMQKNFNFSHSVGPRRGSIIQEGASDAPKMAFSGIILRREQYYAFEFWYQKRIMLDLTDDLGRTFRGALDVWSPKRVRRTSNVWYHTYDAEFVIYAWSDDTGQPMYGRFQ